MDKATRNVLAKIDDIPVTMVMKNGEEVDCKLGDFAEPKTLTQRSVCINLWLCTIKITLTR